MSLVSLPDWPLQEKLEREKELLGFYISGHPLDKYKKEIELFSNLNWDDPQTFAPPQEIRTGAIITQVRTHLDRKGNIMAFLSLEDKFNSFEGVVFSSIYEKYSDYINKGEMIFILGKVSEAGENTFKLLCNEIIPIAEIRNRLSNGLQLIINTKDFSENKIDELHELIKEYPGSIPLYFEVRPNGNSNGFVLSSRKYSIIITDQLLEKLYNLIGKNNVLVKG